MQSTSFMRRFTIRFRMLGAIGMVVLSLGSIGTLGVVAQLYANSITTALVTRDMSSMVESARLQQSLTSLRLNEKDMVIQYENSVEAGKSKELWNKAYAQIETSAKTLAPLLPQESQRVILATVLTNIKEFRTQFDPMAQQLEGMKYPSAQVAAANIGKLEPIYGKAQTAMATLAGELSSSADTHQKELQAAVSRVVWLIAATTALMSSIIVPLTILNMRSICQPIDKAEQVANAISEGDLRDQHVVTAGSDEAARLLRSLEEMRHSLGGLVGQVRNSTDSISTASTEIASGNHDLRVRTEQPASTLQRAASSMDHLTSTVRQSAEASRQANQLASSAGDVAARGGAVVAQVVSTMSDINTSSKKISDIISVIDGIAIQTNILALNAAVEAARAGEQGRGFAVVASEVRSLAGRSAEAAKEIKHLIGASVERVETGSRLVSDAGKTMAEIVSSVQRVSDIIGEITAASNEQSSGIVEINTAMVELDQMTQQNAALVEQSAAAAESMRDQAHRLAELVGTFKLGEQGDRPQLSQRLG